MISDQILLQDVIVNKNCKTEIYNDKADNYAGKNKFSNDWQTVSDSLIKHFRFLNNIWAIWLDSSLISFICDNEHMMNNDLYMKYPN